MSLSLSLFLYISLSIRLSLCVSVCLCLALFLCVSLSLSPSLSVPVCVSISLDLSVCLPVSLCLSLSLSLSLFFSVSTVPPSHPSGPSSDTTSFNRPYPILLHFTSPIRVFIALATSDNSIFVSFLLVYVSLTWVPHGGRTRLSRPPLCP